MVYNGVTVYWRCICCGKKDVMCKAGGKSAVGSREIVLNGTAHNHDPDEAETKVRQCLFLMLPLKRRFRVGSSSSRPAKELCK